MTFEMTREYLDGQLAVLDALVEQVRAKQGSASLRHKEATLTALGGTVSLGEDDDVSVLASLVAFGGQREFTLGDLATVTHNLSEWAAQVANEATTAILKAQGDDKTLASLREQYNAQKTLVESLMTVFQLVPEVDVSDVKIPQLRAGRSTSPTTKRQGKRGHFYRVLPDGEKRGQSDKQDSLSSMAWYYGAVLCEVPTGSTNNGKGVPVNELDAFLRKNVTDSPLGKPWEIERMVNDQVVKFGMEIIDPDSSEEE